MGRATVGAETQGTKASGSLPGPWVTEVEVRRERTVAGVASAAQRITNVIKLLIVGHSVALQQRPGG